MDIPMSEPIVTCPNCRHEIKLTESLAAPLIEATRKQYEQRISQKDREVAERAAAIKAHEAALEKQKAEIDEQIITKLKIERGKIVAEEAAKAKLLIGNEVEQKARELADLQIVLKDRDAKLADAQKAQAEVMRKQRELEDARREMELTIEKRVGESLGAEREKAKLEAEEQLKLKVSEKEQQIAGMQRQIEELKKRAEQGSQQLQGEVLELELEATLRGRFPHDRIEPVPKGEFGGDVLHRVVNPLGQACGTILWESKRTKNWSDGWLAKLRDDQRAAKAEMALIVTQTLPKGVNGFDQIDGVWVTEQRCAVPVAIALRQTLIQIAATRLASEGQQSKMELVYQYLTGPSFRHRIEAIVEKFWDLQADLDRERKFMLKQWAKREQQIQGVIASTVGMYGDLQGIAGSAIKEIDGLDAKMIETGDAAE
jgi:hypothetical protein